MFSIMQMTSFCAFNLGVFRGIYALQCTSSKRVYVVNS